MSRILLSEFANIDWQFFAIVKAFYKKAVVLLRCLYEIESELSHHLCHNLATIAIIECEKLVGASKSTWLFFKNFSEGTYLLLFEWYATHMITNTLYVSTYLNNFAFAYVAKWFRNPYHVSEQKWLKELSRPWHVRDNKFTKNHFISVRKNSNWPKKWFGKFSWKIAAFYWYSWYVY